MNHLAILQLHQVAIGRGDFILCNDVNLTLHAGDVCHLVGENGLGKTTLLNQISGLLPVTHGTITKSPLVYIAHQLGISPALTVAQNLRFLLSLYDIQADDDMLDTALDMVGLYGLGNISSVWLSAGQKRRIGLARLFIMTPNHAPLWLLDEPLTALDMTMVAKLEKRIGDFASTGGAVLATSHQAMQGANCILDLTEFAL
ncbi:heme ABC exporter ATP-binding protein CcmA [Moraxella nonliquefaciens]|uniref:heme ABC exporter ATP-binding protein CcmA n=1 Tax=Moraxella nonliquefaciens TaxID=478 RepID=UPI0024A69C6E|nr:heme ABC exporter ATP-binding protein CcmA [Moraxella nonliquefaciens]MDI4497929.1 heme ABC exporter ATP-binding protein CcmA [Moraxella nonliquefaciens]MDI4499692.1 heme ABC exporter ATP-binding protein CcmA [Moraxella nonliquefaciens]